MKVLKVFPLLLAAALSGCATQQPPIGSDQLVMLAGPMPNGLEEGVANAIRNGLKDPDSAKFRFGNPERCYMRNAPAYGGIISDYGWCIVVAVNGKNSYGAYAGFKERRIFVSKHGMINEFHSNMWFKEPWFRE